MTETKRLSNRDRMRNWRSSNPEKAREASRKSAAAYRLRHPDKNLERILKWKRENVEYIREFDRVRNITQYGISEQEYLEKLDAQGGVCAICKGTNSKRRLCVDHDHTTGKVRDLLCTQCNAGLGLLQDNSIIVRLALEYLERHQS